MLMFELPAIQASTHVRTGVRAVAFGSRRHGRPRVHRVQLASISAAAWRVPAWIGAAYWFTASTSFANPAITLGRSLSDTFAGIRPADAPGFIAAQLAGGRAWRAAVAVAGGTTGAGMTDAIARAARFNRECECMGTDVPALQQRLDATLNVSGTPGSVADSHPHLFSETPVFLARIARAADAKRDRGGRALSLHSLATAKRCSRVRLPSPALRRQIRGVFFGFDFHINETARNSSRSTPMPAARC